jgi:hypothetical protein
MKHLLPAFCLLLAATAAAAAEPLYVTAVEWAQPRTGAALMQHPALARAMHELQPGQSLQLLYPGGDEGSLWASELQAWLVALGLSSQRIELLPGSPREDAIELRVVGVPDKAE